MWREGCPRQLLRMGAQRQSEKEAGKGYLGAILIRSAINADGKIKRILKRLRLNNKLRMVVFKNTPEMLGQMRLVSGYITFGELNEEQLSELLKARGEPFTSRLQDSRGRIHYKGYLEHNGKKYKCSFRLNPPKGGFERGGIKRHYSEGGALGWRGDKLFELVKRML